MGFRPAWDETRARKAMASGLIRVREFTPEQVKQFEELAEEVSAITDRLESPLVALLVLPTYGEIYKHGLCPHEKGYQRHQCIECGIAWLSEIAVGLRVMEDRARQHRSGERSFKELLPN